MRARTKEYIGYAGAYGKYHIYLRAHCGHVRKNISAIRARTENIKLICARNAGNDERKYQICGSVR